MKKNNMHIPEGFTEQEVMDAIGDVVNMLADKFLFGSYQTEDIKQEAWIFALESLEKFDPTKGAALKTYLFTVVRSRLISLKRDKWFRPAPKDIDGERLDNWKKRNDSKRNLAHPHYIEDLKGDNHESSSESSVLQNVLCSEIIDKINRELPVEYRRDFCMFLDECAVPKPRRLKLMEKIKEIIDD